MCHFYDFIILNSLTSDEIYEVAENISESYITLRKFGMYDKIIEMAHNGLHIMGTCAGAILVSRDTGDTRVHAYPQARRKHRQAIYSPHNFLLHPLLPLPSLISIAIDLETISLGARSNLYSSIQQGCIHPIY